MHEATIGPLPQHARKPKPEPNGNGQLAPWEDIATIYPYHSADGDPVLEVVRTLSGSPRFRQRRPNGRGGWIWSVKGIPGHDRMLYRLPGLRASGDEIVCITEGEKDADRLHGEGLIATTNIGGAGKWRNECTEEFRGKRVVVLQDNDDAGLKHAAAVAASLAGVAASVKVLLLPGLPDKADVSDWLDAGNTIDELERLVREAPEQQPEDDPYAGLSKALSAATWLSRVLPAVDRLLGDFITTTTRAFIVGRTGLGKTMLGLAIAMGIGFGTGFLHWRSSRPGRVLFIDGEMPAELLIQRIRDAARRIEREDMIDNVMVFSTEDAEVDCRAISHARHVRATQHRGRSGLQRAAR
jgi:AAA domain